MFHPPDALGTLQPGDPLTNVGDDALDPADRVGHLAD
jgi:hypothetical protein